MKHINYVALKRSVEHFESNTMSVVKYVSFTFDRNRFIYPFPFIIYHQIEMCKSVITILIIQIREWQQKKERIRYAI